MWFLGNICDPRGVYIAARGTNSLFLFVFENHSNCLSTILKHIMKSQLCITNPLSNVSQNVDVYIGQKRTALLRIGSQMRVGRTLEQLLAHLEPQIKRVLQVMSFSHSDIIAALSDRVRLSPGNKESIADSMRAFKSSPGSCVGTAIMWSISFPFNLVNIFHMFPDCFHLFFRVRDNIQSVEPRPKVTPATLGHRGCSADLHSAFAHKVGPLG